MPEKKKKERKKKKEKQNKRKKISHNFLYLRSNVIRYYLACVWFNQTSNLNKALRFCNQYSSTASGKSLCFNYIILEKTDNFLYFNYIILEKTDQNKFRTNHGISQRQG